MTTTTIDSAEQTQPATPASTKRVQGGLLDPKMLLKSTPDALRKLDPRTLWRNPVMFIVEIGAVWSTVLAIIDESWFAWLIVVWLWLTVLFANLAEAVAEGRGKAQAETLRKAKTSTLARRLKNWAPGAPAVEEEVAAPLLQQGDVVVVEAGQVIPGDGDVVEGIASVDESAITGESAPVIRESGGDRSAVTGGTTVLSDRIVVKITQKPGESFIDRMIALVEGANRQKTPNEIALNILLAALTIIFVFAVATLQPLAIYSKMNNPGVPDSQALNANGVTGIVMVSLLVCLIPTTIGALLRPSASPAWTGWCSATCLRCPGAQWKLPATSTPCCSTRRAPSPWAIGRPRHSSRSTESPMSNLPTPRSCPASPMKHRKGARSLCSPSSTSGCAHARRANSRTPTGWHFPRRQGCRVSTSTGTCCARERPAPSRNG